MEGLSASEVEERRSKGLINSTEIKTSRTYADIIVKNVFTPLNILLFIIGISLILLGNLLSAISATGVITINILISTYQEIKAKRRLDRITLLTRPKVTVLREGEEVQIDQNDIVQDDIIVISAGEQALVDGDVLECKSFEVDESLLTGESTTVRKNPGDKVLSGSFCVTGTAYYQVTAFGNDSFASQMLTSAKKFTSKKTPLQMETQTITTVLGIIAFILLFLSVITEFIRGGEYISTVESVLEIFVICLDIIPVALFLLITLTYMLAAIRMADTGILLQRFNAVESMSHVDTVCMDKTGTITTNNLLFESVEYMDDEAEAERIIKLFISATGSPNKTITALKDHYETVEAELLEEIQFSSSRKYSAVKVACPEGTYTIYSGAWSVLREHTDNPDSVDDIIDREARKGFRTLVICRSEDKCLTDGEDFVINPLHAVAVISIKDQVRPDCRETIDVFLQNGMDLKVISGDDPITIESLFKIADIPGERKVISGPELEQVPSSELDKVILETNIFGRMKPENKETVIEVLKRNDRYVAMIGDGVNDVKSIKTAQVGIALHSGSSAARGVADMILLDDNFSALPRALVEGRRTTSGIRDILKVYLSRNFALAIIFFIIYFFIGTIPLLPVQNMFYAFLAVTIIAFFMTIFAQPERNDELILPDVLRFSIPSAFTISIIAVIVFLLSGWMTMKGMIVLDYSYIDDFYMFLGSSTEDVVRHYLMWVDNLDYMSLEIKAEIVARSNLVLFCTVTGALQLLMVCPYFKFLSTNGKVNKRVLPLILVAFVLTLITLMYLFFPIIATVIGMAVPSSTGFLVPIIASCVAFVLILIVVRKDLMKNLVKIFEDWYMRKLQKEYTKGDVVNEEGIDLNIAKNIKKDLQSVADFTKGDKNRP